MSGFRMIKFKVFWRVRDEMVRLAKSRYVTTVTYPPANSNIGSPPSWEAGATDLMDLDYWKLGRFHYPDKRPEEVTEDDCDSQLAVFAEADVFAVYRRLREEFHAVTRLGFVDIEVAEKDVERLKRAVQNDYKGQVLLIESTV